jgi:hypothetical protein
VTLEDLGLEIPHNLGDVVDEPLVVGSGLGNRPFKPLNLFVYEAWALEGLLLVWTEHRLNAVGHTHHDPGTYADTFTHDEPVSLFCAAAFFRSQYKLSNAREEGRSQPA